MARRRGGWPAATLALLLGCVGPALAGARPDEGADPDSLTTRPAATGFEWAVQPVVSWSEEQGVGAGAKIYALGPRPAATRVESMLFFAQHDYWTTEATYRTYRFIGTATTLRALLFFMDDGSARFFGVGNASAAADEVRYERRTYALGVEPGRRLGRNWEGRLRLQFAHEETIFDPDPLLLGTGTYSGESSERVVASVILQQDRRDIEWAPRRGSLLRIEGGRALGPDLHYWRWALDARAYHALGSDLVAALRLETAGVSGDDPPFYLFPIYGGGLYGRGQYYGRYRDATRRSATVEVRWTPHRQVGLVAFADAGEVAPGFLDAAPGGLHGGVGGGLRVMSGARGLISRADLAYGGSGAGWHLYLNFGHAF